MKKIIVKTLLLGQIMWVFHNGMISEIKNYEVSRTKSIEIRVGNSILKVVCVNFLESMKQIIELSCLLSNLENKKFPNKSEHKQKVELCYTSVGVLVNYGGLNLSNNQFKGSFGGAISNKVILIDSNILILWLLFMFIYYLYKYKVMYFFLRARSSIDNNFVVYREKNVWNPNCFCELKDSQEQLGFFIYSWLISLFGEEVLGNDLQFYFKLKI